ncbi:MAG: NUDIX hydrolase [Muribaculaceae bacterium]|nr:NUDIX hydrolase [Muribaculaceae bacterium]
MFCYEYPHPAVTADCIVYNRDNGVLKVLLIKRGNEPYKDYWAFPGGFMNIDESAEDAALRELKEETGLVVNEIRQLKAYSTPGRDPRERVVTITFISECEIVDVKGDDDAAEARWFQIDHIPPLAFDHELMLKDAISFINDNSCC